MVYGIGDEDIEAINSLIQKGYLKKHPKFPSRYWMPYKEDILQPPLWRDRKALQLIKEGLCKYLKSIDKAFPDSISVAYYLLYTLKQCVGNDDIDIFTFNYTPVPLQDDGKRIPVHYMHGDCKSGKIIIGTRDVLDMAEEYDFLQKAMDDSFTPPDIITPLKEADEVIIFGHSLGENDRQYFAPFFLKQVDYYNDEPKNLTIFTRDDKSKIEIKRALQKMTDGRLSSLLSIKEPVIIRTTNIQEDQNLMYNFLVAHHTERHYASEVVNKLI